MQPQDLLKLLVDLFLRLNGYFSTGHIVHSAEKGKNKTEIDCLAVRFPRHYEPEREVQLSPHLQVPSDRLDLVIAEVKSGNSDNLWFNEALWEDGPEVVGCNEILSDLT